jgi:cytochrome oxidase Cu insertion factor (SCO1/SenC/PrrC family)
MDYGSEVAKAESPVLKAPTCIMIHAKLLPASTLLLFAACAAPEAARPVEGVGPASVSPLVLEESTRATLVTPMPAGEKRADRFADVELTTHDERVVKFRTDLVRDRAVLLNFMYTSCTGI